MSLTLQVSKATTLIVNSTAAQGAVVRSHTTGLSTSIKSNVPLDDEVNRARGIKKKSYDPRLLLTRFFPPQTDLDLETVIEAALPLTLTTSLTTLPLPLTIAALVRLQHSNQPQIKPVNHSCFRRRRGDGRCRKEREQKEMQRELKAEVAKREEERAESRGRKESAVNVTAR